MKNQRSYTAYMRVFNTVWPGVLFLTAIPLLLHFAFSWMGFNPGTHGMILAGSRRILHGQLPWRDFFAWHAPLSYFLHLPVVIFGGDRVFWWARLVVWFQLSVTAWLFAGAVCRVWKLAPSRQFRFLLATIALAVSAHNFPLDLSASLDALFFFAFGVYLIFDGRGYLKFPAYLLFGVAAMCKPGFIVTGVLALVLFRDWRNVRCWIALLFPALVTITLLACAGSLSVAWRCLAAVESWSSAVALIRFRGTGFILAGYLGLRFLHGTPPVRCSRRWCRIGAWLLLGLWPGYLTLKGLALGTFAGEAYSLFWLVTGIFAYLLLDYRDGTSGKRGLILIFLTAAFAVVPDYSYATPAPAAGVLVLLSFIWLLADVRSGWRTGLAFFMAVALLIAMNHGRNEHGHHEQLSKYLDQPLDRVLGGGQCILVNSNVYEFLSDFDAIMETVSNEDRQHAVIPELAAYWVSASQVNPMPSDTMLFPRGISGDMADVIATNALERMPDIIAVVQKTRAGRLDRGVRRYRGRSAGILRYLTDGMQKTDETRHFEIYEQK